VSCISDLGSFLLQPHHSCVDYKRLWLPVLWFGLCLHADTGCGSGLHWAKRTVRCFWLIADIFQLKIHRAKVMSLCVRIRNNTGYFIQCYVWLQLCVNFAWGVCYTKRITNGDEGKDGHAVKETHVFGRICMFFHRMSKGVLRAPYTLS